MIVVDLPLSNKKVWADSIDRHFCDDLLLWLTEQGLTFSSWSHVYASEDVAVRSNHNNMYSRLPCVVFHDSDRDKALLFKLIWG